MPVSNPGVGSSVTTAEIEDGQVTTAKLAAGAVTKEKSTGLQPDNKQVIMTLETDETNYTNPTAAIGSSQAVIEDSPEESNDFTGYASDAAAAVDYPTTDAVAAAVLAATDKLTVAHRRASTNAAYLSHDLTGAIMTDEKFVIEISKLNISEWQGGQIAFIGMSSGLGASSAALDRVGMQLGSSDANLGYKAEVTDGVTITRAAKEDSLSITTDYWIDLICDGADLTINVYNSAAKSSPIATATESIAAAVNLRYFIISGDTAAGSSEKILFTIDKVVMYANQETGSTIRPASAVIDDDEATYHQTESEIGASVYADMNAVGNYGNLVIYPHANSSLTEFIIESSVDAVTWEKLRTVLWSAITEAAYNYITLPVRQARYFRVKSNDAGAATLAIAVMKLNGMTDSALGVDHTHKEIVNTDTSLTLAVA